VGNQTGIESRGGESRNRHAHSFETEGELETQRGAGVEERRERGEALLNGLLLARS